MSRAGDRRKAAVAKLFRRQGCRLPPWARRGRRCACRQFWRGHVAVSWQVRTIRGSGQMGDTHQARLVGPGHGSPCAVAGAGPAVGAVCADVAVTSRQSLQRLERRPRRPPGRPARESGERCALARARAITRRREENADAGDGASAGTYEESVSRSEGSPSAESPPRSATHASSNALLSSAARTRSTGSHIGSASPRRGVT